MAHRYFTKTALLAAGCLFGTMASAQVTLTVTPTVAPNAFGSPSFAAWGANAINALYTGQVTGGTFGTPTYYSALPSGSNINSSLAIATGFPSWNGVANPAAPFAAELGNRVHWSISVVATGGQQVSLAGLNYTLNSTDGVLSFSNSFTTADVYSPFRVGVIRNGPGTADDVLVTSGPATQLVDEFYYIGVGNAYAVLSSNPGVTDQDRIDIAASQISGTFSASYTIPVYVAGSLTGTETGNAVLNVVTVPEPGTMLAGILAVGGLVWRFGLSRRTAATLSN